MFLHTFRRKTCDWIPVDHPIEFLDEVTARHWTDLIQSFLYDLPERPLHLFVVVNPFGGSQKADSVWQDIVKPIFERAHITCDAFRTGYRDHAVELLQQMTLEQFQGYNGIVAIGGDGLFQECLRGLLGLRARGDAWQHKAAMIRIAQVPAGSTDAVACTINGCRSAVTAALHVVLGDRAKLDVLEVRTKEGQCRYACSTASYGFVGDVLGASERMRWMGPARYDVSGMLTFMNLKAYAVRLWYKLPVAPHTVKAVCCSDCPVCSEPVSNRFDVVGSAMGGPLRFGNSSIGTVRCQGNVLSPTGTFACEVDAKCNGFPGQSAGSPASTYISQSNMFPCHRSFHMRGASGFGEQMILDRSHSHHHGTFDVEGGDVQLRDVDSIGEKDGWFGNVRLNEHDIGVGDSERWHCWEGEVSSLMIVVTPTRSDKSKHGIVPHAHLSDGRLHLVIVRRCTRWQFFRFLLSLTQGGVDESLSFVDVKEVEAWRCEELTTDHGSVWNVDGELMRSRFMSACCHHGLVNVFGRGPELS